MNNNETNNINNPQMNQMPNQQDQVAAYNQPPVMNNEPITPPEQPIVDDQTPTTSKFSKETIIKNKNLIIGIATGVIVFIIVISILTGGKKVVCTSSMNQLGVNMKMEAVLKEKRKNVETSIKIEMTKDGGFSDEELNSLKEDYQDQDDMKNVKVKKSKNKITVTGTTIENNTNLKNAKEELTSSGFTCK